jgi:hypothetical protein
MNNQPTTHTIVDAVVVELPHLHDDPPSPPPDIVDLVIAQGPDTAVLVDWRCGKCGMIQQTLWTRIGEWGSENVAFTATHTTENIRQGQKDSHRWDP